MKEVSNCDSCINFVYDDEDECYVCDMNLDEDDMVRFLTGTFDNCPYYQLDNEYLIVPSDVGEEGRYVDFHGLFRYTIHG